MMKRGRSIQISLVCFLVIGLLLSSPQTISEVSAYTETLVETFENDTHIDLVETNVTGVGTGEISLPARGLEVQWLSDYPYGYYGEAMKIEDGYAYVYADDYPTYELHIYNISDPLNPEWLSKTSAGDLTTIHANMELYNKIIYLPTPTGLELYNVSDPLHPSQIADYSWVGSINDVVVQDNIAYLSCSGFGLRILNVTDPVSATSLANYTDSVIDCRSIDVYGNMACIGENALFQLVNLTDIHNPTQIVLAETHYGGWEVLLDDDILAYGSTLGPMLYDVSTPANPVSLSNITGGFYRYYIESNWLISAYAQLRIFDISDPQNPIDLFYLPSLSNGGLIRDVAISGDYFYLAGSQRCLEVDRYKDEGGYFWDQYKTFAVMQTDPLVEIDSSVFDGNVFYVTVHVDATTPEDTSIKYFASARNGSFWTEVFPETKSGFGPVTGKNLKLLVELNTTDTTVSPTIRSLNTTYTALLNDPSEISPFPPATLNDTTPTFIWYIMETADSYLLQIDTSSDFDSSNLVNLSLSYEDLTYETSYPGGLACSFELSEPLADGEWYWRVAAIDSSGQAGEFTQTLPFTIDTGTGTGTDTGFELPDTTMLMIIGGLAVAIIVIVIVIRRR